MDSPIKWWPLLFCNEFWSECAYNYPTLIPKLMFNGTLLCFACLATNHCSNERDVLYATTTSSCIKFCPLSVESHLWVIKHLFKKCVECRDPSKSGVFYAYSWAHYQLICIIPINFNGNKPLAGIISIHHSIKLDLPKWCTNPVRMSSLHMQIGAP